ncbi:M4 family metallopeptidase [Streptomyces sp. HSW2009]|uniref:M4 family metallopeptidase n=1 Tax=Streptomyces sp. HSW2009 TaxID=3142890 RepID=UPI0032F017D0
MRTTFGIPTSRRTRRAAVATGAVAAVAALVAPGLSAGPAGASDASSSATARTLTASQRAELLREATATTARTADALGLGNQEKLLVKDVIEDRDGTTHTRYERTYAGLPVLGGDLVVHEARSGKVKDVTKATKSTIKVATTTAKLAPSAAERTAIKAAQADDAKLAKAATAPRKVVWAADGAPVLAYETVVGGVQQDGTPNQLHVITDANTGRKIFEYQGIKNGTGKSQYSGQVQLGTSKQGSGYTLTDAGRGGHRTLNLNHSQSGQGQAFTDTDDAWGTGSASDPQTAAVDAHYGAALTWDYYKNVHGRNGIKGDGKGATSRVHYGNNYQNAFWDDSCFCMTYGDGAGNTHPLTSIDVAAHEMSHGVTSNTAGLVYRGESGGLNEATSDIFATAVEFHAKNPEDVGDYLIGEEIDLRGNGTPLRYMDKPSQDRVSLDYWSRNAGNVDVHYSSGIANHWFFLASEGSGAKEINGVKYNSPTADGSAVQGIGREKAEKIWFKALTTYMTSTTNYADARKATLKAATDLYGANSAEVKGVAAAWTGVNVK